MVFSVGWTVSDTSYKNFNLVGQKCRTNGRRFTVEVDAFSAPAGMRELERIMREEILTRPYFDKKIWKKYRDVFTQDKVKMRLLAALGEWIGEEMEDSGNNNSSSSFFLWLFFWRR